MKHREKVTEDPISPIVASVGFCQRMAQPGSRDACDKLSHLALRIYWVWVSLSATHEHLTNSQHVGVCQDD